MGSFLAWLMGIDVDPGSEVELRLNNQPEGWVVFVLLCLVIGYTTWVYYHDGRQNNSPLFRIGLGVLRVALLLIALLILTEPVVVATKTEVRPSNVLVMVDQSFSMDLKFPYAEEKLRNQIKTALGDKYILKFENEFKQVEQIPADKLTPEHFKHLTRMMVACQALRRGDGTKSFFEMLEEKHGQVRLYGFCAPEGLLNTMDAEKQPLKLDLAQDLAAQGQETRLGDALRQAMKELRGVPLAGVVVLTDGRQNAGEDPVHVAASQFKVEGVPVFTVGVGDPGEPKDLELSFSGPDVILPDDPTEVVVNVRQTGYDSLGKIEVVMKKGDTVVATKEIALGKSGEKVSGTLQFREAKAGKYSYELSIAEKPGELRKENNKAGYKFEVVDKKVKVLFVEGQDLPRWEYRFLKNALRRDHTSEVDVLLATSEGEFLWDGTDGKEPLQTFPQLKKEIEDYDVLILGDINPVIFTAKQMALISEFVHDSGGGLIMIAGERFNPSAYLRGPLSEMLPVVPKPASYQTPDEGIQDSFPVELTATGKSLAWTHLDPDETINREIWDNLPKLFWYYPVEKVKSLATTVAVHPFDKDAQGKKMPLIAYMPYGTGRTMFIGVDSLWRWRRGVGDRYHYRFYNQAIRFLSMAKRLGGQRRYILGVDKGAYAIGDKVHVTGIFKDRDFKPLQEKKVTVYFETPKGEIKTAELNRIQEKEGEYEGDLYPSVQGDFSLWLKDEEQPDVRQAETAFKVDVPKLELENPRMDEELLKAVAGAGATGGGYYSIDRLKEIPKLISPKEEKIPKELPFDLWDNWVLMAIFTGLITAEWLLRKRGRMI